MSSINRNHVRYAGDGHPRNAHLTPPYVLEPCRELVGGEFALDPCTEPYNPTMAKRFYSLPDDGSALEWNGPVWLNPPYGASQIKFLERAIVEAGRGMTIIALVPARTETKIIQRAIGRCASALLVNGRLQFQSLRNCGRREAASHGSILLGFNVDLGPLARLGVVVKSSSFVEPTRVTNTWDP